MKVRAGCQLLESGMTDDLNYLSHNFFGSLNFRLLNTHVIHLLSSLPEFQNTRTSYRK